MKTKDDLLKYDINGITIGEDIYESYLKLGNPTISFSDCKFWRTVSEAFIHYLFWLEFFQVHNVTALVVSHDCYILSNVPARLAYKYQIPVYLPSPRSLARTEHSHSLYRKRFLGYKSEFLKLPRHKQESELVKAKSRLERRLNGEVGVDMPYSTATAFTPSYKKERVLALNTKPKVVIYTHCFYDNPHAYGGMIFTDFLEWLNFLGDISRNTEFDWYIKCHPDALPGTSKVIQDYVKRYPHINLLPNSTSTHQLVSEGLTAALTCYGTIGHELPLLGVRVINAGFNPHISYTFNTHPMNKDEYARYIYAISEPQPTVFELSDIYAFYYMHYSHYYIDSLVFDSYNKCIESAKKFSYASSIYQYYLDTFNFKKHLEAIYVISKYLESESLLLDLTMYEQFLATSPG